MTLMSSLPKKQATVFQSCRNGLLENDLLRRSGFFVAPSFLKPVSLHFIVQTFDGDKKHAKLTKFDNWFFVFGDYDVF